MQAKSAKGCQETSGVGGNYMAKLGDPLSLTIGSYLEIVLFLKKKEVLNIKEK